MFFFILGIKSEEYLSNQTRQEVKTIATVDGVCKRCQKRFSNKRRAIEHNLANVIRYGCAGCGCIFKTKEVLMRHQKNAVNKCKYYIHYKTKV